MAPLPAPIRAGLGLLATALDTVQELVEHAPEIPMEAVGNSMQLSMRLQQHYVALLTRGDEFIAGLRGAPDEPPAWATFDDLPPTADGADPGGDGPAGDDLGGDDLARAIFDDDLDIPSAELQDEPRHAGQGDPLLDAATAALEATAGAGSAATEVPAKQAGKRVAAKKVPAAIKKAGARKTPARKVPAKKGGRSADAASAPDPFPALASAAPILTTPSAAGKTSAKKAATKKSAAKKVAARKPATVSPTRGIAAHESAADDLVAALDSSLGSITAPPRLDSALDNGDASARPQSAFDLIETPDDVLAEDSSPNESPAGDSAVPDALAADPPAPDPAPGA